MKAITNKDLASGLRKRNPVFQTLSGQDLGKMLLNIEARIGELSKDFPRTKTKGLPGGGSVALESHKAERMGLAKRRLEKAQTIHRNPAVVAEVIKEAKENEK